MIDPTHDITASSEEWWEDFYASGKSRWSGKPNASLVRVVEGLAPGTALDLGCGQGGDAIWLATQGWTVTGADISAAALEVAERNAAAAGLGGAITWARNDLSASLPPGTFDLVAATFLHSPVPLDRTRVLRAAAAAVAPRGTLLVVGHAPSAAHPHGHELPTLDEVLEELALPPAGWAVRTQELHEHDHAFAGEAPVARTDTVLRLERVGG